MKYPRKRAENLPGEFFNRIGRFLTSSPRARELSSVKVEWPDAFGNPPQGAQSSCVTAVPTTVSTVSNLMSRKSEIRNGSFPPTLRSQAIKHPGKPAAYSFSRFVPDGRIGMGGSSRHRYSEQP